MEKKEPIKVDLGTVIIVFVLIIAVIAGIYVYIQKVNSDKEISELKQESARSQATINELQNKLDNISNIANTDTVKETKEVNIDIQSDIVKNAYSLVSDAHESFYQYGNIKSGNIPNKLKLVLGYWQLDEKDYNYSQSDPYKCFSQDSLEKSIKKVLANRTEFTNETFNIYDFSFNLPVNYDSSKKIYIPVDGGGDSNIIDEVVVSATTQDDYLNIYVKSVYLSLEYDKYSGEFYDAYKDYDFKGGKGFVGKIKDKVNFYEKIDEAENDISKLSYNIDMSELNTYKYTFKKDGNNYIFDSFELQETNK